MKLSAIRFKYKKSFDETQAPQIGVIAQDVDKYFPEFVYHTKEGRELVYYDKLTTVLLKGVQELNDDNDKLQAELKATNEGQAQRLKNLEEKFEAYRAAHP